MPRKAIKYDESGVALYHCVDENEGFNEAAQAIFELVMDAQNKFPGKKRHLYLDIEEHRNGAGGFDSEMFELQKDFVLGFLLQFVTEVNTPLYHAKNDNHQNNDVPQELHIQDQYLN